MNPDSIWKIKWFGDRMTHVEYVQAQTLKAAIERFERQDRPMPGDTSIVSVELLRVLK